MALLRGALNTQNNPYNICLLSMIAEFDDVTRLTTANNNQNRGVYPFLCRLAHRGAIA